MPNFTRNCDVYQGYNYKKDKQSIFGYIKAMKVNDTTEVTADQNVIKMSEDEAGDATKVDETEAVVSVLRHVSWDTGTTDAIYLTGQLSSANKQTLEVLLYASLVKVTLTVQFTIWEYDPLKNKYFKCMHTADAVLNGLLEKSGSELNLHIDNLPASEVQSPKNFTFSIGVKPIETGDAQEVHLAVADGATFVKAWGIKVGA